MYLLEKLNRHFPPVRGAVFLIVLPAFFVVITYFFTVLTELVIVKEHKPMVAYENRLASLKQDLPAHGVINYVSDRNTLVDFIMTRYVLIPIRLVRGLKPMQAYLILQNLDTTKIPKFDGYTLQKDYGNGVILFKRNW